MITTSQHIVFNDIIETLELHQDRTALIDKDGRQYSYKELKTYITGARAVLAKRGVKKGSKVLVFVPMSLQLYAILEGLFSLGATAIFLDPWMKGKKMGSVIKQVQPDLFVVTKKISRISWILPATWSLKKWKLDSIIPNSNAWIIEEVDDNDNALITFTSGTSGMPKGANRTFSFLHAQSSTLKSHMKRDTGDVYIDYTNFPIVGLADFAMGNTVVIPRINLMKIHKSKPEKILEHLIETKVNRIIVSPSLLKRIISKKNSQKIPDLKEVVTGGAPISNMLISKSLENFPEIKFEAIYGSTESEPICITTFEEIKSRMDEPLKGVFVGQPIADIQLKIIEATTNPVDTFQFHETMLEEGEIGEIVVTGAHVNKNYYNNRKAFVRNKILDSDGEIWHRTGDIGYLKEGDLFLVGREHRIMEHEGKKIYPYPLEQYIEYRFGLTDTGYIQLSSGEFILFIGTHLCVERKDILDAIHEIKYPIDKIIVTKKPLPRDARHKSKLQIEDLI